MSLASSQPIVYRSTRMEATVTPGGRLVAGLIAAAALSVLITAAVLKPSPDGTGTHTALHLQRCQFMATYGIPCPSCGMTTSFAWFARGNIFASVYVQPMGTVLAVATALTVWTGLFIALTALPVHQLLLRIPSRYYQVLLPAFALGAWAWKIFIHLHGMDGWH